MTDEHQPDDRESPGRTCSVCGASLEPEDRFCRNCGTPVESVDEPARVDVESEAPYDAPTERLSEIDTEYSQEFPPGPEGQLYESEPGAAVIPPESVSSYSREGRGSFGSRTWIIILVIAALVLVVCCCLIFGIIAIASADTSFQDELDSALRSVTLL